MIQVFQVPQTLQHWNKELPAEGLRHSFGNLLDQIAEHLDAHGSLKAFAWDSDLRSKLLWLQFDHALVGATLRSRFPLGTSGKMNAVVHLDVLPLTPIVE